jgi:protease-4
MFNAAVDDAEVKAVMLAFDSPGGAVTGVPEAAAAVARGAERKPVIAYADGQMCSAAYYIASQASQIYAMPSAQVGSIGVYLALLDYSRAAEMQGIKVEMFKSGKHKGMGQPGTTLTDEQRAMLQGRVDALGTEFRATVTAGRMRDIDPGVMQGQSFSAKEGMACGLIDGVCSFDEALSDAEYAGKMR